MNELPRHPEIVMRDEVKKTQNEAVRLMDYMEEAAKEKGEFFIKFGKKDDIDENGEKVDSRVLVFKKEMTLSDLTGNGNDHMQVAITRNGPRIIITNRIGRPPIGRLPTYDLQRGSRFETVIERDGSEYDYLRYGWRTQDSERLYRLYECLERGSAMEFYQTPFWKGGPAEKRRLTMQDLINAVSKVIEMNYQEPSQKPSPNSVIRTTIQEQLDERRVIGNISDALSRPPSRPPQHSR